MDDCQESDFVFKWTKSCRLCLTSDVEFDIFPNSENTPYLEKIKSCLNVLIYRGDPMPQKLCLDCWKQLEEWFAFREKCLETDRNLKMRLKPFSKVDFVDEYLRKCAVAAEQDTANSPLQLEDQSKGTNGDTTEEPTKRKDLEVNHVLKPADSTCLLIKTEVDAGEPWNASGIIATIAGGASEVFNCSLSDNVLVKQEFVGNMCSLCHENVTSGSDHNCAERMEVVQDVIVEADETSEDVDGSYNLRPKVDAPNVSYEELEDWVEDEVASQPFPIQEKAPRNAAVLQRITPFKCTMCQIYFQSKTLLLGHFDSTICFGNSHVRFNCHVCKNVYFSQEELAEHQLCHLSIAFNLTVDELVKCSKCDLLFADTVVMQQHAKLHVETLIPTIRKFNCAKCQIVFDKRGDYDRHRRIHKEPPPLPKVETSFKCDFCPSKFSHEERLIDHRFLFHGLPDDRVECQTCKLKLADSNALAVHELSHKPGQVARKTTRRSSRTSSLHKEHPVPVVKEEPTIDSKPVRCRRCGRLFKSQEELRQHELLIHKNLSPHYCRKCSRRFATRSQLLFHYRSHFNQKGQPLDTIKSSAALPDDDDCDDNLQEESMIEDDGSGLSCIICDIDFLHQEDKSFHSKTHISCPGRKHMTKNIFKFGQSLMYRYQCSNCPQLFCSRGSLNRHRDSAHVGIDIDFIRLKKGVEAKKIDGYSCSRCNAKFPTKSERSWHSKKEHRKPEEMEASEGGHELVSDGSGCVPCQFCNKLFNYSYIARHIRQEHRVLGQGTNKVGYQCRYCSKICSTSFNLQKHESCHDPDRKHKYLCKLCSQGYDSYPVYQKHKKQCNNATKSASPVVLPTPNTPPAPAPPRPVPPESLGMAFDDYKICPICLNSYETNSLLELHVMTAHGAEAFKRLEMAKPRPIVPPNNPRRNFVEHEQDLWHEEANNIIRRVEGGFRCTFCHIHLSNVMAAMYHRTQHPQGNLYIVQVDSNVFQCTVCPNAFRTRNEALYHAEQHTVPKDVKPPPLHRPMHRNFNCPFCSSTFNCEDSIRSHIYYVHPEGVGNSL